MPKNTKLNSEQIFEVITAESLQEIKDFKYLPEFTLEKLNMESFSDDELYSALKNSTPEK